MSKQKTSFINPVGAMAPVKDQPLTLDVPAAPPWEGANPKVIVPFLIRSPEPLHAMLKEAALHTPGESMHSFALKAVEEAVRQRLRDLGKL